MNTPTPKALPENPIEAQYCCTHEGDPPLGRVSEEFILSLYEENTDPRIREVCEVVLYDLQGLMLTLHSLLEELIDDPDIDLTMDGPIKRILHA